MVLCNIFKNNFALEQMKINTLNPELVIDIARGVHYNKKLIKIESWMAAHALTPVWKNRFADMQDFGTYHLRKNPFLHEYSC